MSFFKKMFPTSEQKGQTITDNYLQMINAIQNGMSCDISDTSPARKLRFIKENLYYLTASPVASSIDIIAEKFSEIIPILEHVETKEIIRSHPVLDLLARPNKSLTRQEFMFKYAAFFLMNGNTFITGTGLVTLPPNELDILLPTGINTSGFTTGHRVGSYRYTQETFSMIFNLDETGQYSRYFTRSNTAELWHAKMFNPEEKRQRI